MTVLSWASSRWDFKQALDPCNDFFSRDIWCARMSSLYFKILTQDVGCSFVVCKVRPCLKETIAVAHNPK